MNDGKSTTSILQPNGKYIETVEDNTIPTRTLEQFTYDKHGRIIVRRSFYNDLLSSEQKFMYKNGLVKQLSYYDSWGDKEYKPDIIIFKYKFDKHHNWIECIKNVNGKDLYKWKRIIQYY